MNLQVWYCAAPVSAPTERGTWDNLQRAARWLRWLRDREPHAVIIAPWLGPLLAGTERDDVPEDRARGLRDCVEVVKRCDGIVLVGGRITKGMQLEIDAFGWHKSDATRHVADLTSLGEEPPDCLNPNLGPISYGRQKWEINYAREWIA